jgi:hypothetical protein
MKNYLIIGLTLVIIALFIYQGCNKPITNESNLVDENERLTNQIDILKKELAILSVLNDSLSIDYINTLNKQDSVRIAIKTKYITIVDTTSQDTIECLPKKYVEELINYQDSVNLIASKSLKVKDDMIGLLTETNAIKDTIISNKDEIIDIKDDEIKKHKKGKIKSFFVGVGVGIVAVVTYIVVKKEVLIK